MPKVTIAPIGSLANQTSFLAQLNNALQTLAGAFDATLSRDDTAPNQMEAALDANSHTIINLPHAVNNDEAVPLGQLSSLVAAEVDISDITGLTLSNPRNLDFIRYQATTAAFRNTRTADLPIAALFNVSGPVTLDRSVAEVWQITLSSNIAVSVTNWGPSGQQSRIVLQLTAPGSASIISWPTNTLWPGGVAPVLSPNGLDIIILTTFNGGATIFANVAGFDYA